MKKIFWSMVYTVGVFGIGYSFGKFIQTKDDNNDIDNLISIVHKRDSMILELINQRNFAQLLYEVTKYESD